MHNVITNAWRGDPYRIDTLMIFMANMAWNSTMNTVGRARDAERQARGRRIQDSVPRRLRRVPVGDDRLRRPGAARHDLPRAARRDVACSTGRSPSSTARSIRCACRSCRRPGECKPFQEVLIELAARLKLPAFTHARGHAQVHATIPTSSSTSRPQPGRASAFSSAGAARTATSTCAASRTRSSGRCTRRTTASSTTAARVACTTCATGIAATSTGRSRRAVGSTTTPIHHPALLRRAAELPPRRAGQERTAGSRPSICASASTPTSIRCRSGTAARRRTPPIPQAYPLNAITQRPMAMYHSWDSQNAWLRQIHSAQLPVRESADGARARHRRRRLDAGSNRRGARCAAWLRYSEAVEPGTVWTWNAIGKARARGSSAPAPTNRSSGFLLNHLISDELPQATGARSRNSDPVTGQAGWYDVRVRHPARAEAATSPQIAACRASRRARQRQQPLAYFARESAMIDG